MPQTRKKSETTTAAQTPLSDLLGAAMRMPSLMDFFSGGATGCDPSWALRLFHFYGFQTDTVHGGAIRLDPRRKQDRQEIFTTDVGGKPGQPVSLAVSVTNLGPGELFVVWDSGKRSLSCNQSETLLLVTTKVSVQSREERCMGMYSVTFQGPAQSPPPVTVQ